MILNVLIACEESQTECAAFRALGHNAFSCDLQPCSGNHPEWHVQGDALELIDGDAQFFTMDWESHTIVGGWDLIVAHPPCTYLCKSSSPFMFDRPNVVNPARWEKAMQAKQFFMAMLTARCNHVAVENPTPIKRIGLPPYSCVVNPFEFGHPWSKRTCLWLKNLPPLIPTLWSCEHRSFVHTRRGGKRRSKSFAGIAEAMAVQWSAFVMEEKQRNSMNEATWKI